MPAQPAGTRAQSIWSTAQRGWPVAQCVRSQPQLTGTAPQRVWTAARRIWPLGNWPGHVRKRAWSAAGTIGTAPQEPFEPL